MFCWPYFFLSLGSVYKQWTRNAQARGRPLYVGLWHHWQGRMLLHFFVVYLFKEIFCQLTSCNDICGPMNPDCVTPLIETISYTDSWNKIKNIQTLWRKIQCQKAWYVTRVTLSTRNVKKHDRFIIHFIYRNTYGRRTDLTEIVSERKTQTQTKRIIQNNKFFWQPVKLNSSLFLLFFFFTLKVLKLNYFRVLTFLLMIHECTYYGYNIYI